MKSKPFDTTRIHNSPSLGGRATLSIFKVLGIWFIFLTTLMGCLFAQEYGNLINNGDFEADSMGCLIPSAWKRAYGHFEGDIEIIKSMRSDSSGKQCVQFSPTDEMDQVGLNSVLIPIDPKKTYIQSGWIKTEGRTTNLYGASLGHAWYDGNKRPLPNVSGQHYSYVVRNTFPEDWAFYSQELVPAGQSGENYGITEIPQEAAYVEIRLVSFFYKGKSWFDDLRFEEQKLPLARPKPADGKVFRAGETTQPPVIDGVLNDSCWQQAVRLDEFALATKEARPQNQTSVLVTSDKDTIYLGIICHEDNMGTIKAATTQKNKRAIFHDDCVEIFFDPNHNHASSLHLTVNSLGATCALAKGEEWNMRWQVKTSKEKDCWIVEAAIPKKEITLFIDYYNESPARKELWGFNVARERRAGNGTEFSSWSPVGADFDTPELFGHMLFQNWKESLIALSREQEDQIRQVRSSLNPFIKSTCASSYLPALEKAEKRVEEISTINLPINKDDFISLYVEVQNLMSFFKEKAQAFKAAAFALEGAGKEKGYIVFHKPPFEPVYPTTLPSGDDITASVKLTATPGEFEPATFSVFAAKELRNATIKTAGLNGKGYHILPENVDLRVVKVWKQINSRKWILEETPELLVKDDLMELKGLPDLTQVKEVHTSIPAATSKTFWITVKVPDDAVPGTYTGEVVFSADDIPSFKIPITLEVLPFRLDDADKDRGIFYQGVIKTNLTKGVSGAISRERCLDQLRDIRAHGFDMLILYFYYPDPFNPETVMTMLKAYREAGFTKSPIILGSELIITDKTVDDPKAVETLLSKMKRVEELRRLHGFPSPIYFGRDEPESPVMQKQCNVIFECAHQVGAKTSVACIQDETRSLIKGLDISLCSLGANISTKPDSYYQKILRGDKAGYDRNLYYFQNWVEKPQGVRMASGLFAWKSRSDGFIPYCQLGPDPRTGVDVYHEILGKGLGCKSLRVVYPTVGESIPTIQWEASREGIDDLKYVATLEHLIVRAEKLSDPPVKEAIGEARKTLLTMSDRLAPLLKEQFYSSGKPLPVSQADLSNFRNMVSEHIIALKTLLKLDNDQNKEIL